MCQAIQSKCTNAAEIQNNHRYEQCGAYLQDHTSCLTVLSKTISTNIIIIGRYTIEGHFLVTVDKIDTSTKACW